MTDHPTSADDWLAIVEAVEEMVGQGMPPSNREARDLLPPVVIPLRNRRHRLSYYGGGNQATIGTASENTMRRHDNSDNRKKLDSIRVHWLIEDGWVHTHGLDALGFPELEARHIPGFLGEFADELLRATAWYMIVTGRRIHPGEEVPLSARTRFRLVTPKPFPGNEDHYEVERLLIVDR